MRAINETITKQETRLVEVPVKAVNEEFHYINEFKTDKYIDVCTVYLDSEGNAVKYSYYKVDGENYDYLMSQSPDFANGKPENEYREEDLWYIIDLIKTKQTTPL